MGYKYTFTVFTPTYNRAYTLHRVYDSLSIQTLQDFEWLIVDDGSNDDTKQLVENWQAEAWFPIRYIYQKNGGKHRAFNRGVSEARGELFLTLDSDDKCTQTALERFKYHWDQIDENQKDSITAVTSICTNEKGEIVGNKFPIDGIDSNTIEIRNKYGVFGEKWGFQRTDVLKKYPFPEFEGERYIPPALVWNRIAETYKTRYINEPLRIYEVLEDGITASSIRLRMNNPKGSALYYSDYMKHALSIKNKTKGVVNYIRFSLHGKYSLGEILSNSNLKLLTTILLLPGYFFYCTDKKNA